MKMSKYTGMMALIMLLITSCNKELFDEKAYNEAVNYKFMVDNADPNHDWCLTKSDTVAIKIKEGDIRIVQVLTDNPYTSKNAEIAAQSVIFGGWENISFTIPVTLSNIYIAALDNQENYLGVIAVPYNIKKLELSIDDLQSSGTLNMPKHQTFTYLYECDFPMPGDFDYNDMVLRINKKNPEIGNTLVVDLVVRLEACGASQLYAAGIQLADISYDDIKKVEILEGAPMDNGYPFQRQFMGSSDVLLKARNGNAIINLFECAQWALSKKKDELGDIPIINYNVTHDDIENKSATVYPCTATYRITFKDRDKANSLTLDRIDPFITHQNSDGGIWEVHTYAHKFDETLRELYYGNTAAYDNHISWSLVIPKGDFRYTTEGMPLCTYQSSIEAVFGPYEGFADWMKNHLANQNWYQTITREQLVY